MSSEMSEQDSESDTTAGDTQESKHTETLQIHHVSNKSTHTDQDDSSEELKFKHMKTMRSK